MSWRACCGVPSQSAQAGSISVSGRHREVGSSAYLGCSLALAPSRGGQGLISSGGWTSRGPVERSLETLSGEHDRCSRSRCEAVAFDHKGERWDQAHHRGTGSSKLNPGRQAGHRRDVPVRIANIDLDQTVNAKTEEEVRRLRDELARAQLQLQRSEIQLQSALTRIQELERSTRANPDSNPRTGEEGVLRALQSGNVLSSLDQAHQVDRPSTADGVSNRPNGFVDGKERSSKALNTTGRIWNYSETLKDFWYPVIFSKDLDDKTLVPIECFEEPWVIFRGVDGKPGCLRDECAHRACPLSLGTVQDGRVACPYHGWEFTTSGKCEKMPSTTKCSDVGVRSLPCIERDGLVWIWAGSGMPTDTVTPTMPPSEYVVHAELVMELPVEHGLLVENLLDLAHAPFTHTSTFARGWSVPSLVRFKTAATRALQGHWDPYPIAMEFRPPCMVVSTIGLAKPGQLEGGQTAAECSQHLFQMHACIPVSPGKTRLLYRMGLDFASWVKHVPFIDHLWTYLAGQVLDEDLRLVLGQQERMHRGANVWNHPVIYDKLGVRYRRWRDAVEAGEVSPFL